MSARPIDALLFDLGNVLVEIDFDRVFAAWGRSADLGTNEVRRRFELDAVHRAFEVGRIGATEFFDHVRALLGAPLPDATLAAGWNQVFVGEVPGMAETVAMLARRVPLYVLSNTNSVHHEHWRQHYASILDPFTAVFTSCELGERKPERAAYASVLTRIGVDADRVLFFDDLAENVAAARAFGMAAFVVRSAEEVRAATTATLGLADDR
jgi:putative hydrolase of the HAD superfamily